jgi:hypothetical protein
MILEYLKRITADAPQPIVLQPTYYRLINNYANNNDNTEKYATDETVKVEGQTEGDTRIQRRAPS